ncbi:hypothetical protein ACFQDN_12355 [Pseudomonas asuensis]|jgi:hypothetical protein|nr:hypothetical protein [Pseudomonas asuensis]
MAAGRQRLKLPLATLTFKNVDEADSHQQYTFNNDLKVFWRKK